MVTLNWVDVVLVLIMARAIYIGNRSKLFVEFLKFLGLFLGTVLAVHFYSRLGIILGKSLFFLRSAEDIAAYALIIIMISLIFTVMHEGWQMILKIEFNTTVNKWGGRVFSCLKGYLICAAVFMGFLVTENNILVNDAKRSVSSIVFSRTAIDLYRVFYVSFIANTLPNEKINVKAIEAAS